MSDINFAEICWGDYELDGRIVPYIGSAIVEEDEWLDEMINEIIDELINNY